MKNLILCLICCCISFSIHGQTTTDTIQIRVRQVNQFYFHGKKLKPNEMLFLTKSNPEAYQAMKVAKSKYGSAQFFAFTGGFILGWQLGRVLTNQPAPWSVTLIGAGALVATIPFSNSYSYHADRAAKIYNRDLQKSVGMERVRVDMGITSSGVGMRLTY